MTTATIVKRGPGRPRKNPEAVTLSEPVVKRGPGRPRKNPETVTTSAPVAKRGPGRPRKNPEAVTTSAPVAKRGPGRPRKNPETAATVTTRTATVTSTSKSVAKSAHTRQILVNPFRAGDVVNIPAGSTFTSSAPTLKGRQKVKRGHKVTVVDIIPAHIQPRNSETGSKVLIRPTRIRAKGSGSYWKDITLTEKILKFNGKNSTYETVNVAAAASAAHPAEPAEEPEVAEHEPIFSEEN